MCVCRPQQHALGVVSAEGSLFLLEPACRDVSSFKAGCVQHSVHWRHKPSTLEQSSCFLKARKRKTGHRPFDAFSKGSDLLRHQLHLLNKVQITGRWRQPEDMSQGFCPIKDLFSSHLVCVWLVVSALQFGFHCCGIRTVLLCPSVKCSLYIIVPAATAFLESKKQV